jgi:hypothetical protein
MMRVQSWSLARRGVRLDLNCDLRTPGLPGRVGLIRRLGAAFPDEASTGVGLASICHWFLPR